MGMPLAKKYSKARSSMESKDSGEREPITRSGEL